MRYAARFGNSGDTILIYIAKYFLDHLCCMHGRQSKEKPGPDIFLMEN